MGTWSLMDLDPSEDAISHVGAKGVQVPFLPQLFRSPATDTEMACQSFWSQHKELKSTRSLPIPSLEVQRALRGILIVPYLHSDPGTDPDNPKAEPAAQSALHHLGRMGTQMQRESHPSPPYSPPQGSDQAWYTCMDRSVGRYIQH